MNEKNFTVTVGDLAKLEGVDYQVANGLLRFLREKGIATETGKAVSRGKGRSATEYQLPKHVEFTFNVNKNVEESVKNDTEAA